ncbi:thioredoxin family protein [soil metagenome]
MRFALALVLMLAPTSLAHSQLAERSPAEEAVASRIAEDGIHVIHFWAPWCDNSISELESGWYEAIEDHDDVTFTFVTVWSDGAEGRDILNRYAIPDRVTVLKQEDRGPSEEPANRIRSFLGLPMTWVPTTWVFHRNGQLAYAFNFGEMEMAQLDRAIADVKRSW